MEVNEIITKLKTNLVEISFIKDIEPFYGGLPLNNCMTGLLITMDDPVKTQLKVYIEDGKLKLDLSQMEGVPTRVSYLKN